MNLLVTGGHFTPAMAVIERIEAINDKEPVNIFFVGRKNALNTEKTLSLEYKEITSRNITFIHLETGRITRLLNLNAIKGFLKIPLGFLFAFRIVLTIRPDRILSFGGYIALPVVISGWLLGVPVYTHEQTISPGIANRIIGMFSKTVFYSFERSARFFSKKKRLYTGNPIRNAVKKIIAKPFELDEKKPVVYITGGSLGSHSINEHVLSILDDLLNDCTVIHQIGNVKEFSDYDRCIAKKKLLSHTKQARYFPVKHLYQDELGYVYTHADIVVGRAGANTFFELIALQKPAVLIPLPWSAAQEQQKQAELFAGYKLGEVFEQKKPSSELLSLVRTMLKNKSSYELYFRKLPFEMKQDAAEVIAKKILLNS